jgi:hypothetical protein
LKIIKTPNVSPSQLHLAVVGGGVLGRLIVDGSSGGRPLFDDRVVLLV